MNSRLAVNTNLVLVALIWGFGFVPQRLGMDYLGPYAFNALRFACGAAVVGLVLVFFRRRVQPPNYQSPAAPDWCTRPGGQLVAGLLLGLLLFGGATAQQVSIQFTTIANVAFITGMYVIIVPIFGWFAGHRYPPIVWFGGALALVGLFFMTGLEKSLSLQGDLLAMLGAVFWALHLLLVARLVSPSNQLQLAFLQFLSCSVLSAVLAVSIEQQLLPNAAMGYVWLVLNGVVVVGLAYTLQLVVLQYAEPFVAAIIFSLEAVFGAVAAYLFLDEIIGWAGYFGALCMFMGCTLSQTKKAQFDARGSLNT